MNRLAEVVPGWPLKELRVNAADAVDLAPDRWHHYRTDCNDGRAAIGGSEGLTAWIWSRGHKRAVIAWEWIELSTGVLVLADPNALASNLRFVGELQGMERVEVRNRNVLMLNTIVHGLRWQERVLSEVRSRPLALGLSAVHAPLH
jgi:hypothetical protein